MAYYSVVCYNTSAVCSYCLEENWRMESRFLAGMGGSGSEVHLRTGRKPKITRISSRRFEYDRATFLILEKTSKRHPHLADSSYIRIP